MYYYKPKINIIMKNVIIMALTAIFILSGCKSKEEKALEIIKNEMFKTLYDFESYQPIETKVDSAFYQSILIQSLLNMDIFSMNF